MLSSLSTSLKVIFKERNDQSEKITLVIPANIRFGFYKSPEEVEIENKFSAIPLTIPLTDSMETAYDKIQ